MQTQRIRLRHMHRPHEGNVPVFVHLREICGNDELALPGVDTRSAISLLERLLQPAAASGQGAEALAHAMSAADRDALLAILHRRCWGDRIVSTLHCRACGAPFDLSFTLSELQLQLHERGVEWLREKSSQETWRAPVPPSGAQEIAAADLAGEGRAEAALHTLIYADEALAAEDARPTVDELAVAMENAAPILDVGLDAQCAECGHAQQAHFDVQSFVLQRLLNERELLMHEIHTLATGYGWTLSEILGLPRSTRRSFVQLLSQEAQRPAWQRTAEQQAGKFWS